MNKFYIIFLSSAMLASSCGGRVDKRQDGVSSGDAEVERVTVWLKSQRVDGLCHPDEEILFQCVSKVGRLALCSGETSLGERYLQFRRGSVEKLAMAFPEAESNSLKIFSSEFSRRSMGGESAILFTVGGDNYRIFSVQVGVRPGAGSGDFEIRDGLEISGQDVEMIECTEQAEVPVNLSLFRQISR